MEEKLVLDERLYETVLKSFPIGLLVIDKDKNIIYKNKYIHEKVEYHELGEFMKCYHFFNDGNYCVDCPLDKNLGQRKLHRMGNRYYTVEFVSLNHDMFLAVFRETTREILLLKEIKEDQQNLKNANAMIQKQNDLLKQLSLINIKISRLKSLESILKEILNSMLNTFGSCQGAIIITNSLKKIESAYFSDKIDESSKFLLIEAAKGKLEDVNDYKILWIKDDDVVVGKIFLDRPSEILEDYLAQLYIQQINTMIINHSLQRQLEELAHKDSLTGAFNRYYLNVVLEREVEKAKKFNQPISLILADVNGLKKTNDLLGHEVGDELIKQVVQILGELIKNEGMIFRFGGDEFIIILTNCDGYFLNQKIKLLKDSQKGLYFEVFSQKVPISYSVGGVCSSEVEFEQLINMADKKMYEDKEKFYQAKKRERGDHGHS